MVRSITAAGTKKRKIAAMGLVPRMHMRGLLPMMLAASVAEAYVREQNRQHIIQLNHQRPNQLQRQHPIIKCRRQRNHQFRMIGITGDHFGITYFERLIAHVRPSCWMRIAFATCVLIFRASLTCRFDLFAPLKRFAYVLPWDS